MAWVSPNKANLGRKMAEHNRLFNDVPIWFKKSKMVNLTMKLWKMSEKCQHSIKKKKTIFSKFSCHGWQFLGLQELIYSYLLFSARDDCWKFRENRTLECVRTRLPPLTLTSSVKVASSFVLQTWILYKKIHKTEFWEIGMCCIKYLQLQQGSINAYLSVIMSLNRSESANFGESWES